MSLELPSDLTPYTNGHDNLHAPGAYALQLGRPVDLADRWPQHYDEEPDYWGKLIEADRVVYVGGTSDLLSRLEDHRNNDDPEKDSKRGTVLTRVCDVVGLQTAWVTEDATKATEIIEPRLARLLQQAYPSWYVHTR